MLGCRIDSFRQRSEDCRLNEDLPRTTAAVIIPNTMTISAQLDAVGTGFAVWMVTLQLSNPM